MANLFPNIDWMDLLWATGETLYMTLVALIGTLILGTILGLLIYLSAPGNLWENKIVYSITAGFVNIFRAIPFIILIFLILPLTVFLFGTFRGPTAALPALILGSAPFYGRLVEIALREVDLSLIHI